MITLRCTQKLLKRLGETPFEEGHAKSRLGDWHGKEIFAGRRRAFLFVNDETSISVILPAKKGVFQEQFQTRYAGILYRRGVSAEVIATEIEAAKHLAITRSNSRRHLGVLNEMAFQYQVTLDYKPEYSDEQIENRLMDTLVGAVGSRDFYYPWKQLDRALGDGVIEREPRSRENVPSEE